MKKILLILAIALMLAAPSMVSATTTLEIADAYTVNRDNTKFTYEYTTDNVTSESTTYFKIPVPQIAGAVVHVKFKSASTDCDVWGATKDAQPQGSIYEVFRMIDVNLDYAPEMLPQNFRNRDTTEAAFLYVAVQNNDTVHATGAGTLSITFDLNN